MVRTRKVPSWGSGMTGYDGSLARRGPLYHNGPASARLADGVLSAANEPDQQRTRRQRRRLPHQAVAAGARGAGQRIVAGAGQRVVAGAGDRVVAGSVKATVRAVQTVTLRG